jgi:hypothetical protein
MKQLSVGVLDLATTPFQMARVQPNRQVWSALAGRVAAAANRPRTGWQQCHFNRQRAKQPLWLKQLRV